MKLTVWLCKNCGRVTLTDAKTLNRGCPACNIGSTERKGTVTMEADE